MTPGCSARTGRSSSVRYPSTGPSAGLHVVERRRVAAPPVDEDDRPVPVRAGGGLRRRGLDLGQDRGDRAHGHDRGEAASHGTASHGVAPHRAAGRWERAGTGRWHGNVLSWGLAPSSDCRFSVLGFRVSVFARAVEPIVIGGRTRGIGGNPHDSCGFPAADRAAGNGGGFLRPGGISAPGCLRCGGENMTSTREFTLHPAGEP